MNSWLSITRRKRQRRKRRKSILGASDDRRILLLPWRKQRKCRKGTGTFAVWNTALSEKSRVKINRVWQRNHLKASRSLLSCVNSCLFDLYPAGNRMLSLAMTQCRNRCRCRRPSNGRRMTTNDSEASGEKTAPMPIDDIADSDADSSGVRQSVRDRKSAGAPMLRGGGRKTCCSCSSAR